MINNGCLVIYPIAIIYDACADTGREVFMDESFVNGSIIGVEILEFRHFCNTSFDLINRGEVLYSWNNKSKWKQFLKLLSIFNMNVIE
jgi:hypothetical protein